jgi:dihydrofolate synthase/folylpolyglutamate synthase
LLAFADANVELAILETGLGGRLDATTAANAEIAAITRIDLDHQQYLGETIEEIAAEKAAIIHEGSEVVVGNQEPAAMTVILDRCREMGVAPILAATAAPSIDDGSSASSTASSPLGLAGRHQHENAQIAIALAHVLDEYFAIADDDVRMGLRSARHPGRLEWIGQFLFDGAHNIGGARALRKYLDEFVDRPITMIFGAMGDKDVNEIGSILFPKADRLIFTRPDNSRAMKTEELLQFVPHRFERNRVFATLSTVAAIDKALEVSGNQDAILVTGSLYLVGEVRRILTTDSPEKLKT